MKTIVAFLTILIVSLSGAVAGSMLFDLSPVPVFASLVGLNILAPVIAPGITPLLVFTAPGGIGAAFNFNMTELPQWLIWNHGANPLTSLRIESAEDGVIQDLNAAAIAALNGYMVVGALPATTVKLPLANGKIRGRNVTISGVTAAAGAIGFNASSDGYGNAIFKVANAAILALNPTDFSDFTAVFAPTMGAGDTCQVQFQSGHIQIFNAAELNTLSSNYNQVAGIIVNNANAYIKKATFQCALATPAYMMSVKKL